MPRARAARYVDEHRLVYEEGYDSALSTFGPYRFAFDRSIGRFCVVVKAPVTEVIRLPGGARLEASYRRLVRHVVCGVEKLRDGSEFPMKPGVDRIVLRMGQIRWNAMRAMEAADEMLERLEGRDKKVLEQEWSAETDATAEDAIRGIHKHAAEIVTDMSGRAAPGAGPNFGGKFFGRQFSRS